jgi:hypothetical protein
MRAKSARAKSVRLEAAADAPSQQSGGMEGGGSVTQKKTKNRGRKRRGVDSAGDELHNRKVYQQMGIRQRERDFFYLVREERSTRLATSCTTARCVSKWA